MAKSQIWTRMHLWQEVPFSTCWRGGAAQQKVKEGAGVFTIGLCVSRCLSEKVLSTESRKFGAKSRGQSLQEHMAPFWRLYKSKLQDTGKEGSIARDHSEAWTSRGHERSPCNEKDASPKPRGTWRKNIYKFKKCGQSHVLLSYCSQVNAGAQNKISRGTRFRDWFRSFNAHAEEKRFKLRRTGDCEEIQNSYRGGCGKLWSANKPGSTVTVQIFEDTPTVPLFWKLCEEHGDSHEWVSSQK